MPGASLFPPGCPGLGGAFRVTGRGPCRYRDIGGHDTEVGKYRQEIMDPVETLQNSVHAWAKVMLPLFSAGGQRPDNDELSLCRWQAPYPPLMNTAP